MRQAGEGPAYDKLAFMDIQLEDEKPEVLFLGEVTGSRPQWGIGLRAWLEKRGYRSTLLPGPSNMNGVLVAVKRDVIELKLATRRDERARAAL